MTEILILFYFLFIFLFSSGIFYYFILFDKRIERRLNYYLDIDKKYKKLKKKRDKGEEDSNGLKNVSEFINGKLSAEKKEKLEQFLKSAGLDVSLEQYIMLRWVVAAIVGGIGYFIFGNILFFPIGGIVGYLFPKLWVDNKRHQRLKGFNEGLADMITTMIGSLRSGYSFSQAMKTVSEECESPIKEEITLVLKEMSYGITVEEALNSLNQRMPSNDLELMIQAILIQRQVGGNLSTVLEIIVRTIRERNKLERQVQALTSQGRLSGRVIGVLPVVLGLIIYLINPEYMTSFVANPIGKAAMSAGVVFGIVGFIMINKLTRIEV